MSLEKFKGVFVAFYSAYDDEGNVSPERAKKLAQYYIDKGVKGLYVGGSSGEGVLDQKKNVKRFLKQSWKLQKEKQRLSHTLGRTQQSNQFVLQNMLQI